MCDVVNTDVFLAFLLNKRSEVSFRDLRHFRSAVEKSNPEMIVDISGPSLELALHNYPKLFCRDGDRIRRADTSEHFFASDYIQCAFLSALPSRAAASLQEVISR